ncbi:rod shape-determining protein MreC [Bryocella elongata]|uniref:Cell shape-determining protein MreC n=1 Tax=Bryocella elongata TaxID=863522 RepID=A0A1H6B078_9BACT|nr:rod shape-determining protein MreC [Bryocella elongata]SEG53695.1 rod shape-determining protein MreC [Bryocella elongata]
MDSFLQRFKNPLVLIAIVLAQVLALAVQVQKPLHGFSARDGADGPRVSLLRSWISAVFTPIERGKNASSFGVRNLWFGYINLRHTHQENEDLKKEIARLKLEQDEFAEDAAQGRRLQALMAFKQRYVQQTVGAQIIGTSGSDQSQILLLDKGADFGLKPDQAVMTPDGVVGKIRDVFPHTAQLLLLNDPTSGAGVLLVSTRMRAILRGGPNGQVIITNLTADSRLKPGEQVVTSGGDQVFPRGLPVGVITSIAPDPQHQPYLMITLKPNADLSRLEEVLVITGTTGTLPADALADATTAEGVAEANKRAADLIAERLPSLHDDAGQAATGAAGSTGATNSPKTDSVPDLVRGTPGIPNSGLPRPRPALHPDRYSPGTVEPAQDLQPGARPGTPPTEAKPPQDNQDDH